jgi:hypothetical protein
VNLRGIGGGEAGIGSSLAADLEGDLEGVDGTLESIDRIGKGALLQG